MPHNFCDVPVPCDSVPYPSTHSICRDASECKYHHCLLHCVALALQCAIAMFFAGQVILDFAFESIAALHGFVIQLNMVWQPNFGVEIPLEVPTVKTPSA